MAVNIQFDSSYNPLPPTIVLAKKDGTKLGILPDHDLVYKRCFNSYSEMSFDVIKDETYLWDNLVDFKLIWAKEWDIWFECYVQIDEDNMTHKHVSCRSLGEAELSQINIYGMEINTEDDILREDYKPTILYDGFNDDISLLTKMLKKAPHYSIRHVSNSVRHIQRTFSFNDENIYNCLQQVATEENLYISYVVKSDEYGKPYRCISVYDMESYCPVCGERGEFTHSCPNCGNSDIILGYGDDSRIFIDRENIADSITYETNTDAVKNCFKLEGGDDLMTAAIISCNPNGSSFLWYIPDETKSDMPSTLVDRLAEYDTEYDYYNSEFVYSPSSILRSNYNSLVSKYASYAELNTIPESVTGFPDLMITLYDTIDLMLLLESGLTPIIQQGETTAAQQANRITAARMSPLCFMDTSNLTQTTVNNAALLMAKSIVDTSKYQVKLSGGSGTSSWSGTFTITSFYDETDTATKSISGVAITENREGYVNQMANRTLASAADSSVDITALFALGETSFMNELNKYSLAMLNTFNDACQACMNVLIEQGAATDTWSSTSDDMYEDLYIPMRDKLYAIEDEISIRQSEIDTVQRMQDEVNDTVYTIQVALNFENFLGEELWKIFSSYRREDTYQNSNYISDGLTNAELFNRALEFIETARKDIYKSAKLQHSLSSTLKNFLVMREFIGLTDYFEVGNWIHIQCDENVYHLRLLDYEIDFSNLDEVKVTFSDVKDTMDGVSDLESVMDSNRLISSTYDSVSRQAKEGNQSRAWLDGWQQNGLDLSQMRILNDANNQEYIFDSHGMIFRKLYDITDSYDDKQLKIINSSIFMTDDNWESVKTAIGFMYFVDPRTPNTVRTGYGINGEVIIGKLILGEELGIYNSGATMRFTDDGLFITNEAPGTDYASVSINPNDINNLIRIWKTNSLNQNTDIMTVDNQGNLMITGRIQATSGYIGGSTGWTIDSNCIYNGKPTLLSPNDGIYFGTDGINISYMENGVGKTAFKVNKATGEVVINGYVTFTGLDDTLNTHFDNGSFSDWEQDLWDNFSNGTTEINGGCIRTGYVLADYLSLYNLTVKKRSITGYDSNNKPIYTYDNSSTGTTFSVSDTGLITIDGVVKMSQGSVISWNNVTQNGVDPYAAAAQTAADNAYDYADDAYDLAGTANSTANTASTTASTAKTTAEGARDDLLSLAKGNYTGVTIDGITYNSTFINRDTITAPYIVGGQYIATTTYDSGTLTYPALKFYTGYDVSSHTGTGYLASFGYDGNGNTSIGENRDRLIISTNSNIAIKLMSGSNISIGAGNGNWIFLDDFTRITGGLALNSLSTNQFGMFGYPGTGSAYTAEGLPNMTWWGYNNSSFNGTIYFLLDNS